MSCCRQTVEHGPDGRKWIAGLPCCACCGNPMEGGQAEWWCSNNHCQKRAEKIPRKDLLLPKSRL